MTEQRKIRIIVKRQDGPSSPSYVEEFAVDYKPNMNVTAALMEIRKNPVNAQGKKTNPVIWESVCLEEVCGSCSMVINGKPRQACAALIDELQQPISLAPLATFPIVRDLMVDRQQLFDSLKKVHAWVDIDGPFDLGEGPRFHDNTRRWAYELSKCMSCGCCLEGCPNVNSHSNFMGPAPLSQVRLFNAHPTGKAYKSVRLNAIMKTGGLTMCGNSQNCKEVCPKEIPLTESIAHLNRQANAQSLRNMFGDFPY